jgi:serine protease inhibitor
MGASVVSIIHVMSGYKRDRELQSVNNTAPFVQKLLHALLDEEKTLNVVVSPVVVQFVLTMLAIGATRESSTHEEICRLLGMQSSYDAESEYLRHMKEVMQSLKKVDLARVANGVFADIDMCPRFIDECKNFMELAVSTTMTKKAVNDWVAEKTNGHIKEFLSRDPHKFMLVSALYAGGPAFAFTLPFDPRHTRDEKFRTSEETVTVQMMSNTAHMPYVTGTCFTGVDLAYGNDRRFKARVVLPNEDVSIADVVGELFGGGHGDRDFAAGIRVTYTKVHLCLPRLELACTVDLKDTLAKMMPTAFSGSADFGRMTDEPVQIGQAPHKVTLKVTEAGTEGAAAGGAGASRGMSRPKQVICDREFLFLILDERNDMPLFAARVNKPTAVTDDKAPAAEAERAPETCKDHAICINDEHNAPASLPPRVVESKKQAHQADGESKDNAICIEPNNGESKDDAICIED